MIKKSKTIITVHVDGKETDKLNALKDLISTSKDELFDRLKFDFSSIRLTYEPYK